MYILNQGRVRIEKDTLEKERYTVATLTHKMNVFFGEIALMDNDIRSATVITETDCECYVIKQEDFENLGNQQPHIGLAITREIAKIICSRLRKSNQEYINLFEALVYEIEKSDF
jgi:CRP-like cAMP-binding protein